MLEIHAAAGDPAGIGGEGSQEPIVITAATEEDALDAMRLLSLIVANSSHIRARLHFSPRDYGDYRITEAAGVIPVEPE